MVSVKYFQSTNENDFEITFNDEGGWYIDISGKISLNEDEIDVFAAWLKTQINNAK